MNNRLSRVIGLDVGGGSIKGALVSAESTVLTSRRALTPQVSEAALVDAVVAMGRRLAAEAAHDGEPAIAIGVAVPGIVDETAGVVHRGANLVWNETALRRLLEERLELPTVLLQDARAAALAESLLGAGRSGGDFILVILGTGVGSAVMIDGRPLLGSHGVAGEIGHLQVDPDGLLCGCGARGCVETLASAAAVARRFTIASGTILPAEQVVARAIAGDPCAVEIWDDAIAALASALAAAVTVVDCGLVLFGGGMAAAGPALLVPLRLRLQQRLTLAPAPRLAIAALGNSAGMLGAAAAAFTRAGHDSVIRAWPSFAPDPDGQAEAGIPPAAARPWNT